MSALLRLLRGPAGHPLHPPLPDAVIGAYTTAAVLAVIGAIGWIEDAAGKGGWLALVVGLVFGALAAVTGLADLLRMDSRTPVWRTAILHMLAMVAATALFALAAVFQYAGFAEGRVTTAGLVLTLVGFAVLTLGGWLGGTVVYVHGMRVMSEPRRPASEAVRVEQRPLRRVS